MTMLRTPKSARRAGAAWSTTTEQPAHCPPHSSTMDRTARLAARLDPVVDQQHPIPMVYRRPLQT
ncbi:hypothetical protein [Streptomyces sp. NPDC005547]|uniref:hypothetical protein n=1 Tax=Streptomyces sp. NPDC005547 TaxID=3154887 RepID=UPI0033A6D0BC